MNTYFLNRDSTFDQVEILSATPHVRKVLFKTGQKQGKTANVHPAGVAWGNIYPRIFESAQKPENIFNYKGRCLVGNYDFSKNPEAEKHIPPEEKYIFQPVVKDIIDSIHFKKNIILTGPSGVGKTSCINQMARAIRQPVIRINFNAETRMSHLIGKTHLKDGQTVWEDGVIPQAMRNGYWIIFDEIDYAPPEIMSLIYPILEKTPSLTLKENNGEVIYPASTFLCFATSNTIGAMQGRRSKFNGTGKMSEALLNRFDVFHMQNMNAKEELKLLRLVCPQLQLNFARKMVEFASRIRSTENREEKSFSAGDFSTRMVMSWAEKAALHRSPCLGAKKSWLDKVSLEEQEAAIRALALVFGEKDAKCLQMENKKSRVTKKQRTAKAPVKLAA